MKNPLAITGKGGDQNFRSIHWC